MHLDVAMPKITPEQIRLGAKTMADEATEKLIMATIDKIRPFLQRDGGDIDYVGFRDGIVYVSMVGACNGCSMAGEDISAGVEIILMEEVPGVMAVKADGIPEDIMTDYLRRKQEEALKDTGITPDDGKTL